MNGDQRLITDMIDNDEQEETRRTASRRESFNMRLMLQQLGTRNYDELEVVVAEAGKDAA